MKGGGKGMEKQMLLKEEGAQEIEKICTIRSVGGVTVGVGEGLGRERTSFLVA